MDTGRCCKAYRNATVYAKQHESYTNANQQTYYDAIGESSRQGQSGPFIDFMLAEIYKTLKAHQGEALRDVDDEFGIKFGINKKQLLLMLQENPSPTALDMANRMGISQRAVEKQVKKLKDIGAISRQGSRKKSLWVINKD